MTYGGSPIIGGVTFPRPNGYAINPEPVRRTVQLAGGSTRAYSSGVRDVFELSWSKLTEAQLVALEAATRSPFVSFTALDGSSRMVETATPSADAVPGTDPVRFSVSLTLRAQDTRR
jgi:hypothetical protein